MSLTSDLEQLIGSPVTVYWNSTGVNCQFIHGFLQRRNDEEYYVDDGTDQYSLYTKRFFACEVKEIDHYENHIVLKTFNELWNEDVPE